MEHLHTHPPPPRRSHQLENLESFPPTNVSRAFSWILLSAQMLGSFYTFSVLVIAISDQPLILRRFCSLHAIFLIIFLRYSLLAGVFCCSIIQNTDPLPQCFLQYPKWPAPIHTIHQSTHHPTATSYKIMKNKHASTLFDFPGFFQVALGKETNLASLIKSMTQTSRAFRFGSVWENHTDDSKVRNRGVDW